MKIDSSKHIVTYGEREIPVLLRKKPRKKLRIVVKPDLSVSAEAPDRFSEEEIHKAIQSKARWIVKQLDSLEKFHPIPTPHRYVSGETFVYLGRQYRLRVVEGDAMPAKLRGRFLNVSAPNKNDHATVQKSVDAWYRNRADDVFHRYLGNCMEIAKRHGIEEPTLAIREMRTRWGSCSASGRVTLNLKLIQAPVHCVEYVIMHELCHLTHHNHSPAFFRLLTRCMPDWEKRKSLLSKVAIAQQPALKL